MSTKDYCALADVIRESAGDEGTLLAVAERMARVFADDNPVFKPDVFYKACGFKVGCVSSDNADLSAGGTDFYPLPKDGA
jgi:hypothetical protein